MFRRSRNDLSHEPDIDGVLDELELKQYQCGDVMRVSVFASDVAWVFVYIGVLHIQEWQVHVAPVVVRILAHRSIPFDKVVALLILIQLKQHGWYHLSEAHVVTPTEAHHVHQMRMTLFDAVKGSHSSQRVQQGESSSHVWSSGEHAPEAPGTLLEQVARPHGIR